MAGLQSAMRRRATAAKHAPGVPSPPVPPHRFGERKPRVDAGGPVGPSHVPQEHNRAWNRHGLSKPRALRDYHGSAAPPYHPNSGKADDWHWNRKGRLRRGRLV
jgi:hypothetical protein